MVFPRSPVKTLVAVVLIANAVLLFYAASTFSFGQSKFLTHYDSPLVEISEQAKFQLLDKVTKTRNELSRQLNEMSKKVGQMECQVRISQTP